MTQNSVLRMPNMTKKQAERILEEELTTRDFWFVCDEVDNFSVLQDVLDTLFNKDANPGNDYVAKYSKGQHNTRLSILCKPCNKELSSYDPFIAHDKGKHHKKTTNSLISQAQTKEYFEKLVFRDMSLPLMIFEEGSLEDIIDHTKEPIVGIEFVYKERIREKYEFTCQLCFRHKKCFRLTSDEMFSHLTSDFHSMKFMEVVFGYKNLKMEDLRSRLYRIVQERGKITAKITEFEIDTYKDNLSSISDSNDHLNSSKAPPRSSPESKRRKVAVAKEKIKPKVVETVDQQCQVNLNSESISEFVEELKNCVEEETEIKSILSELTNERRSIFTRVVKVLGTGMLNFFTYNKDEEFEMMTRSFIEMAMKLS